MLFVIFYICIDSARLNQGAAVGTINQWKISTGASSMPADQSLGGMNTGSRMPLGKSKQGILEVNGNGDSFLESTVRSDKQCIPSVNDKYKKAQQKKMEQHASILNVKDGKESSVFKGKQFHFSPSFPKDRVRFFICCCLLDHYITNHLSFIDVNNIEDLAEILTDITVIHIAN